jgi:hypothetical protein
VDPELDRVGEGPEDLEGAEGEDLPLADEGWDGDDRCDPPVGRWGGLESEREFELTPLEDDLDGLTEEPPPPDAEPELDPGREPR